MKTLLYATDYSENSVAALHFAFGLSKKLKARLTALHVFDVPLVMGSTTSITYTRREVEAFVRDKEKLNLFCAHHLGHNPKEVNVSIKIEEESPIWKGVLEKAKEIGADLIIVGIKGTNSVQKYVLGSTTNALIEKAVCPVLIIPPDTAFTGIERIVYASDFEGSDIFAIEDLVALASPFDAEIHLVHISNQNKKTREDQMRWFKNMLRHKVTYSKLHFETRFGVDVFETLQNYVNNIEPDMIAMLERDKKSMIHALWFGDLVKRMKSKGHYPVLSFRKNTF
jgi:nucleotide-binding universal stress UspA family protein